MKEKKVDYKTYGVYSISGKLVGYVPSKKLAKQVNRKENYLTTRKVRVRIEPI